MIWAFGIERTPPQWVSYDAHWGQNSHCIMCNKATVIGKISSAETHLDSSSYNKAVSAVNKMKNISIEERVLNSVNNAISGTDGVCVVISVETQTVLKLRYNADKDTITIYYLEKDGFWEDAMTIYHVSERNRRFIANMALSIDF